jgi:hypothetical protein
MHLSNKILISCVSTFRQIGSRTVLASLYSVLEKEISCVTEDFMVVV